MVGLVTLIFLVLFSFAGPLVYTREPEFIDIIARQPAAQSRSTSLAPTCWGATRWRG